ncbi:hypothetical protein TEA_007194 [Camellia sinensis var. sinensis]|uniref:TAF6 C-terminal HEAT repeat domain-containing protein n=1 Tax=Camellia sinensis var. sinensis TaxID=542762 RepID=A0A4S4ERP9_CAMSN|nr:hypothetical protein TEA_007194 [Camellia sinensis var. sinensis]
MPSVVTCLVAKILGNRFADNHWELRDFTANLVASIRKRFLPFDFPQSPSPTPIYNDSDVKPKPRKRLIKKNTTTEESTPDFGIEDEDDGEELGDFLRGESDYDDFGDGKRKKFEKDELQKSETKMGIPSTMRDAWENQRNSPLIASPAEDQKILNSRHCTQEGVRAGVKAASIACVGSAMPTFNNKIDSHKNHLMGRYRLR